MAGLASDASGDSCCLSHGKPGGEEGGVEVWRWAGLEEGVGTSDVEQRVLLIIADGSVMPITFRRDDGWDGKRWAAVLTGSGSKTRALPRTRRAISKRKAGESGISHHLSDHHLPCMSLLTNTYIMRAQPRLAT